MTTFEIVKNLAKKQGKSLNRIEEELNWSRNTLYSLKINKPSSERLETLANYFNVSVDYLLGRTDNKNLPQSPGWATQDDLVKLEEMLMSNIPMAYNGVELNEEDKERINAVLTQVFWERLKEQKDK